MSNTTFDYKGWTIRTFSVGRDDRQWKATYFPKSNTSKKFYTKVCGSKRTAYKLAKREINRNCINAK